MSLWTKSYDVTIQMKALCLYFHMMLFVLENEIWKFGRNLPLATFDSERVKSHPFRGRYLGMSVDQPPKKGILN